MRNWARTLTHHRLQILELLLFAAKKTSLHLMTSDTGFSALVWMNEAIGASKKDNNESVLHLAASDDVS